MISAANRIDNMIQDMLDASRLRAGQKMFIKPSACDFVHVVAESCEDFAINYGKRIKFHAPKTASGHWDANALRRAIDNLVGNALKYGAKTTDVVLAVTDFSEKIRFSVHNYGNPLSTHEIDTLFQPFVRTKSAAAGGQSGWGLGLTLVRGVVEMHGGTLGALSSVEDGTTFWFELPKSTVETRTAGNT